MRIAQVPRAISSSNGFDRQILAAYRTAVRRYAKKPWVTGVTIAVRERRKQLDVSDGPVIAIHVRSKRSSLLDVPKHRRIPSHILGVPTDVVQEVYATTGGGGGVVAIGGGLHPGASIGRADGSAATLGAVVRDQFGAICLLCAAHTLREGGVPANGHPIVHPGPDDAGGQFATVAKFGKTFLGLDAGIALFEPNVVADNIALISGVQILAPEAPVLGRIVEKSGLTTQLTQAFIKAVGTIQGLHPAISLFPLSGNTSQTPISKPGDSGAVWYDVETGAAIGLHSGGSGAGPNVNTRAVATWVVTILQKMKLQWV